MSPVNVSGLHLERFLYLSHLDSQNTNGGKKKTDQCMIAGEMTHL